VVEGRYYRIRRLRKYVQVRELRRSGGSGEKISEMNPLLFYGIYHCQDPLNSRAETIA
jgi:hypothetical protein